MKTVTVKITGVSPYSQGKYVTAAKLPKELNDAYDERTWKERLHYTEEGEVFIPCTALKNCLSECAKFLSIQIPGKGKSTYTKHFEAGVLVVDNINLGVNKDDPKAVIGTQVFVPADGVRGSGKRVLKRFPVLPKWGGVAQLLIFDETVTPEVLMHHLTEAGKFIGLGVYRPRNNGYQGRFSVELLSVEGD